MDDELWGNAWGATPETKTSTLSAAKPAASPGASPLWPTPSAPAPAFSDSWAAAPSWEATTTTTADDSGSGWGDSLEYEEQAPEPSTVPEADDEPEEQVIEYLHRPYSPSLDRQESIPHSPLPSSPPPEGSQTTDSHSDVQSPDVTARSSIEEISRDLPTTPRVVQTAPPPLSPPSGIDDSFGGFETGNKVRLGVAADDEEDPWTPAADDLTFTSGQDSSRVEVDPATAGDAWGSAWPAKHDDDASEVETAPAADEWELARARKERRDRKISPEVVSGYLSNWESAVTEIWPDAPPPRSEPSTEWRAPLEDIPELQSLRKLYRLPMLAMTLSSPPPILSPLPPFGSTQHFARQRAALKTTRVSAVSQLSPFAHLTSTRSIQMAHRLSSKPSVSVSKSSLDFGDGVVGVGWAWAHDEKKAESIPASTPSPAPRSSSPAPASASATPTGRFSGFWARARGSTEKSNLSQGSRPNTPVPLTSPSTSSLGEVANIAKPAADPVTPVDSPQPPSQFQAQPQPEPVQQPAPTETTSGVSRFFKRFSRAPTESEHTRLAISESVSLSTSDLEFLEDSVPDSSPKSLLDGGRGLTEFDALEAMLKSQPLPKSVPTLAPPPRLGTSSGIPSPLSAVPEDSKTGGDDLWDIFGAPPAVSNGRPSTPLLPPAAPSFTFPAPSLATTLAPSLTPKLTTPVGSAPASRSHTPRLPSVADLAAVVGGRGSHLRQTSFSTRAQQAFHADVPSLDSPAIPALAPPPSMGLAPPAEADLFADFVTGSVPSQDQSSSARLSFDDFGDFESSAPILAPPVSITAPPAIRSPSPPKPPSKTGTPVFMRTGTNITRISEPGTLPPLLPPPTAPSRSSTPSAMSIPPPPLRSEARAPPPQVNLFDFGASPPRIPVASFPTTTTTAPKPTTAPSKGGLSASDLSFFEGL
ncbi:hypothetical protein BDV93DRAFT_604953 [Ceratobasidium sp. AG-I]|nr:hypothetical protein BDV93DRAFT_604953 [Ceratobasidium sp. AG-I]